MHPIYRLVPSVIFSLFLFSPASSLAEPVSFTVSGPVYIYYDNANAEMVCNWSTTCGYTYTMTATYESDGDGTTEPYLLWDLPTFPYLHTYFTGNIVSMVSTLYAPDGEEVATLAVENPDYNQTDVYYDQGANYWDFIRWTVHRGYDTNQYNYNGIGFYIPPGDVVTEENGYPVPPYDQNFGSPSAASTVAYDVVKNLFYYFYGYIYEVAGDNHGQFMKRLNEQTNADKKVGELSGAEKGQITSEAARKK